MFFLLFDDRILIYLLTADYTGERIDLDKIGFYDIIPRHMQVGMLLTSVQGIQWFQGKKNVFFVFFFFLMVSV